MVFFTADYQIYMPAEREHVTNYFLDLHINFNDDWLSSVLHYHRASDLAGTSLCKSVFDQWLHSDLAESTLSAFQKPTTKVAVLEGCFLFQLVKFVDTANSYWGQYRKITQKSDDYDFFDIISKDDLPADAPEKKSKRMLLLELSDGIQTVKAIEYKPIPFFSEKMPAGAKILIYGKIKMRNGILWLTNQNCQLLGGDLFPLCEINRQEAVLGRLIKKTQYFTDTISEDLMKTKITVGIPRNCNPATSGGIMVEQSNKKITGALVAPKPPVQPVRQPEVQPVRQPEIQPVRQPPVQPVRQPEVQLVRQPEVQPVRQPEVQSVRQPEFVIPTNPPVTTPQIRPYYGSRPPEIVPVNLPVRKSNPEPEVITLSPGRPVLAPINQNCVSPIRQPKVSHKNPFKSYSNSSNLSNRELGPSTSKVPENPFKSLSNFPSKFTREQDPATKKKRVFEDSKPVIKNQTKDVVEDSDHDIQCISDSTISDQLTTPKKPTTSVFTTPNEILSNYGVPGVKIVPHAPQQTETNQKSFNSSGASSETSATSIKRKTSFKAKMNKGSRKLEMSLLNDEDFDNDEYVAKKSFFSKEELANQVVEEDSDSEKMIASSTTSASSSVIGPTRNGRKLAFGDPTMTSTPKSRHSNLSKREREEEHLKQQMEFAKEIKTEVEDGDEILVVSPERLGISNWICSPQSKRRRLSDKPNESKPECVIKYENLKLTTIAAAVKDMKYKIGAKRFNIYAILSQIIDNINIVDDEWTMTIMLSDSNDSLKCLVSNDLLCQLMGMTSNEAKALKKSSDQNRRSEGSKRIKELTDGFHHLDVIFEIEFFQANRIPPKIVGLKTIAEFLEI